MWSVHKNLDPEALQLNLYLQTKKIQILHQTRLSYHQSWPAYIMVGDEMMR
jgi:hypothetical protein